MRPWIWFEEAKSGAVLSRCASQRSSKSSGTLLNMPTVVDQKQPVSATDYYQQHGFNPVPISLESRADWASQTAKRLNLYQRHLGIPLALLKGRSVLEFGCNSGENALVLASFGAKLTLVEPNEQVLPRLRALFAQYDLENQIATLVQDDIESFESKARFDLVLAEGFLDGLLSRDEMICKIGQLLTPNGLAVISFDDRIGNLLESTRRLLLWRVLQLHNIRDVYSEKALSLAKQLYLSDFERLNSSRPFEAWWMDSLMHPLINGANRWSYQEILSIVEKAGCEFYASSPQWHTSDHYSWYKNVPEIRTRHQCILDDWRKHFLYFLTGICDSHAKAPPVSDDVHIEVENLISCNFDFSSLRGRLPIDAIDDPDALSAYFKQSEDSRFSSFDWEMRHLYDVAKGEEANEIIRSYHATEYVRYHWGCPYHYISFCKQQS
ncbi:class I SAM-dependent methyltransferase [bacterium]|nr:class I SAM-dependent methyltransferase [bacterium]